MIRPVSRSERPTVCQLLHGLDIGGAELLATELVRSLSGPFRFVFACLDRIGTLGESLRREGVVVEVLNRQPGVDWQCGRRLASFLRDEHVDLVHAHQYTPFFQALVARGVRRSPPILFTEHGRQVPDYPRRKRMLFNRIALQRQDRVIAVGEAVRQALVNNEGIAESRIDVIYNGVDLTPHLAATAADRRDMRRQLKVREDELMVAQVARLNSLKDHATAIRAIERLAKRGCPARLIVVGDGEERPALEQLVRQQDLGDFVKFLGMRQDVPRILAGADVCLLTSISEGIPLTLIEAMAAGLPVVSTDVGGVAEVVEHERTGFLAAAGDDAQLAQQLAELADNPSLCRTLGENGRKRAKARFDAVRMRCEYERLLVSMLANTRSNSRCHVSCQSPADVHAKT